MNFKSNSTFSSFSDNFDYKKSFNNGSPQINSILTQKSNLFANAIHNNRVDNQSRGGVKSKNCIQNQKAVTFSLPANHRCYSASNLFDYNNLTYVCLNCFLLFFFCFPCLQGTCIINNLLSTLIIFILFCYRKTKNSKLIDICPQLLLKSIQYPHLYQ